jgi:hypothetical protein
MNNQQSIKSKELLLEIMAPFLKLAINNVLNHKSNADSGISENYVVLTIIALLSGIEKILNTTFFQMYISGKIDWKWMKNNREVEPGVIQCNRGLSAKLAKLEQLGIIKNELQWIVDLRNEFIHMCSLNVRYTMAK